MTRLPGETAAEYIARGDEEHRQYKAAKRVADAERQRRWDEARMAELRVRWPGFRVTKEGLHFACTTCGKRCVEHNPDTLICHECRVHAVLLKQFPNRRVVGDRAEFTCELCGASFLQEYSSFYYDSDPYIPRFCSDYCRWASKLKRPPTWTREEWDRIKAAEKAREQQDEFGRFSYTHFFASPTSEYSLGDPQQDANQAALFDALTEYFEGLDDPNRRLAAIQNVIRLLRALGNECHVEIASVVPEVRGQMLLLAAGGAS